MSNLIRSIKTLEFDKILIKLAECTPTEGAKKKALSLSPESDIDIVRKRQKRTTDAKNMIISRGMPPFGSVPDISASVERASKKAVLTTRELLDIASLLRSSRLLTDYVSTEGCPETSLHEIFDRLHSDRCIEDRITRCIISEDMIADEASPALADIRRKIKLAGNSIKEELQRYLSGAYSKYLQENIVTTRGGRYVVPVKAEYRSEVRGLVHDTSASGATVFIEPMNVVEANNELRALESREAHEIESILAGLSSAVAEIGDMLVYNYNNITELAFIFGCGELSCKLKCEEPFFTENKDFSLIRARHPILDVENVVPVTIKMGDNRLLVVTGPNTGGKTVTLKTAGLFAMMAQAGLHIPAESGSVLPVFDEIYADIGDEQSIEQSLSTFSAHMVGIVSILEKMTENSLVLFDELGAGTDPVEGAALAMSVLEEVRRRGALAIATTHYAELKAYAVETENVQNASCEFDVATLKPTYRLIIGAPGKSNAFAISEKLGLSREIIDRAGAYIDSGNRNLENVIEKLESTRLQLDREKAEAEILRRDYEKLKKDTEEAAEKKLSEAEKELRRAEEKARQMINSARSTADYIYAELDKIKKQKDKENFSENLIKSRRDIKDKIKKADDSIGYTETDEDYILPRPLKKGDEIIHRKLGTSGVLLDDPDKNGNCTVQMGIVKSKVNISQLKLDEKSKLTVGHKKEKVSSYRAIVSRSFKPEIDLRGQIGDDAWFMVDKYLDEANVAGVKSVTLIHGKGTGALRRAIWNELKADVRVESYRAGLYGEGDSGVTIVELK